MTALTQSLSRIFIAFKARKKNPDWSRVDEPDNILPTALYFAVGIMLTGLFMMLAYAIMNDSLAVWIGTFLAAQKSTQPFENQLAAFTAVVIALINVMVISAYTLTLTPNGDDVVEMLSDLDENVQERIVELENTVGEKLDRINREIGIFDQQVQEVTDERIHTVVGD